MTLDTVRAEQTEVSDRVNFGKMSNKSKRGRAKETRLWPD